MNYRYLAVDVDGTLLDDHDHYNHQRLASDIQQLRHRGVTFIIASGNSVDALQTLFAGQPVNDFVAENGGRVIVAGREITGFPHPSSTVQALFNYTYKLPQPDLMSASGASQTFIPAQYKQVPVPYYPHHAYFHDLAELTEPIFNVNLSWQRNRLPLQQIYAVVAELNRSFPTVNATYSGAFGIDILPQGVNKASGLKRFVEATHGSLDEVVAIGDTANDIEMVAECGLGIAMKNATPDLKKVAAHVTDADNNHDGMLKEVELLFGLNNN